MEIEIRELKSLPGDDGRHEEAIERAFGYVNGDGELIRREQTKHSRDRLLHGVPGGIRNALGDNRRVQGLYPLEHVCNHGEAAVKARPPRGNELVGDSAAVDAGDKATNLRLHQTMTVQGTWKRRPREAKP